VQYLKLNNSNTNWIYLIERLAKARNKRFENNCPFRKNTMIDDQVEFLWSLPNDLKVTPLFEKDNVSDMNKFYKNYLHPLMLDAKLYNIFKEISEAYEKGGHIIHKAVQKISKKRRRRGRLSV
jgi:hypothetical protein